MPVREVVACGGLPERNKPLMQIYADVTRIRFSVQQTPVLGSAMFAAVAACVYDSILEGLRTNDAPE